MWAKRHRSTDGGRPWVPALVALLALVPYLNGLSNDFTFDDLPQVRDNPAVLHRSGAELSTHLLRPGPVWRPLTMLSYGANEALSSSAWSYRAVNLALHVAVTLCAFALARILLTSWFAATAAAALFAVHPVHTEAVTSIVGRSELLAALAILASLLAAARSLRPGARRPRLWYAVSVVCFAAGPFAKESALTGIGLVIALHAWLEPRVPLRRRLSFLLPFVAAAALYPAMKIAVVGSFALPEPSNQIDNPLAAASSGVRIRTALVVLSQYLGLLALPLRLSADYSYDEIPLAISWWDPRLVLAAVVLLALAAGLALTYKRAPALTIAALFFILPLAVTSNLPFAIGTIKAERFLYLPSFGWCLALGGLVSLTRRARRGTWALAFALVAAALATRTWARNRDWRDNLSLFQSTVATSPNSSKAHYDLGVALYRVERYDEANVHFRRSLQIYPRYAEAAYAIGQIFDKKGLDGGAIRWYERALRMNWRLAKAHRGLGRVRQRLGERDTAAAALLTALAFDPGNRRLVVELAANRLADGDLSDAFAALGRLRGGRHPNDPIELLASARDLNEGTSP